MALPLRVKNALRLGHPVAAEIPSQLPSGRAWVYIQPKMKSGKRYSQVEREWTLSKRAVEPYDDTIEIYHVRLLDLTSWDVEKDLDYETDRTAKARAVRDEQSECRSEADLDDWLRQYLSDFNGLQHPEAVDYWFGLE